MLYFTPAPSQASIGNTPFSTTTAEPATSPQSLFPSVDETTKAPQITERGAVAAEFGDFDFEAIPPTDIDCTALVVLEHEDPGGEGSQCCLRVFGTEVAEASMNPEAAQSTNIMRESIKSHILCPIPDHDGGPKVFGSNWREATRKAIRRVADDFNRTEAGSQFPLRVVNASEIPGWASEFGVREMDAPSLLKAGQYGDPEGTVRMKAATLEQAFKRFTEAGLSP
jgi:hypothetical protein